MVFASAFLVHYFGTVFDDSYVQLAYNFSFWPYDDTKFGTGYRVYFALRHLLLLPIWCFICKEKLRKSKGNKLVRWNFFISFTWKPCIVYIYQKFLNEKIQKFSDYLLESNDFNDRWKRLNSFWNFDEDQERRNKY